ncbi:B12-binding domain/radical SAM domain protein [Sporomusaceae bacterium BoRhaA]|uniref:TIGR04190 family B12-binding domain/radical SAM domain protein n=1 Tax=Pelorhabdus rhamnosifermentans TaxID=2772457 RepID=UPI001C05EE0B|nr:TIGR04190 family B12-binding domain/radical SAM domain protein [Pelorhabdus rhamnosifermentans]MBU2702362.1 B12-binding domain/radical SAM domain protein [Pelorhabdus rhamnosifermentans]
MKNHLVFLHAPSVYDFREKSILYGPISDLVPSTPVFEMYPIGFTTLAAYLEQRGIRVRILNLAVRMMQSKNYDVPSAIAKLHPKAFGIDLHWMPHVHGAIEVAWLVKKYHPDIPVIFGGFSATYFHEELIARPEVDYVVRGDSTEEPMYQLMRYLVEGTVDSARLRQISNLTWKDSDGRIQVNDQDYCPAELDDLTLDYSYVVRSVVRNLDLFGALPFKEWGRYPIMAALSCRGCACACRTCGGSVTAMKTMCKRDRPAFRSPENLARDVRNMSRWSRGPVFILGDICFGGPEYVQKFFSLIKGSTRKMLLEVFKPAPAEFFRQLSAAVPEFILEMSPESHDEIVRTAFGRHYSNEELELTIKRALDAGCGRFDLFFMIGLPKQTYQSVMETIDYCAYLMKEFNVYGQKPRLFPFISPFAPFLDPGSEVFANPEAFGFKLLRHTIDDHREALIQPSWKYVLNYETKWMDRDTIVAATYEAGLRMNRLKARYELISKKQAQNVEQRIKRAIALSEQIDQIMQETDAAKRESLLQAIKAEVDRANLSTVCDKRELELPVGLLKMNLFELGHMVTGEWGRQLQKRLVGFFSN